LNDVCLAANDAGFVAFYGKRIIASKTSNIHIMRSIASYLQSKFIIENFDLLMLVV